MKRATPILLVLAMLVPAAALAGDSPQNRLDAALAKFDAGAKEASAAYVETALGAYWVYGSRLLDAERAATRAADLDAANAIRDARLSTRRLAAEVARVEDLAGLLPVPGDKLRTDAAKAARAACVRTFTDAAACCRETLGGLRKAAATALAGEMKLATDAADLDAANAVRDVSRRIDAQVADRTTVLVWSEIKASQWMRFKSLHRQFWRLQDGELVGVARPGEKTWMTPAVWFDRIVAVSVRGRIRLPSRTNFRMTVGPVNLILNWERAAGSWLRYFEDKTFVDGNPLVPGTFADVAVRQVAPDRVEATVDGRRLWSHAGKLFGAITFYPSESMIGVTDLRVLGRPNPKRRVRGPSHRLW